jgi:hypothetical protein
MQLVNWQAIILAQWITGSLIDFVKFFRSHLAAQCICVMCVALLGFMPQWPTPALLMSLTATVA